MLHEKECSLSLLLYWNEIIVNIGSSVIWVTGSDTGSVASRAGGEMTIQGGASGMEGALTLIFWKSETSRDIKK